jgi:Trypsin-like peptidase domain
VSLPEAQLTELRALLQRCSAYVVGADGATGSGFFVDDRLLLTCAHVVQGGTGTEVRVKPRAGDDRTATVLAALTDPADDVALVEVPPIAGEPPQPAVVLDRALSDQIDYYAVGFPTEKIVGKPGIEEIRLRGHRREGLDKADGALRLIFDAGQGLVAPGLSGGAVLSTETGAVAALVQYTNDALADAGGAAIPLARAADAFEQVAALVREPPVATRQWRDALGPLGWQALNKQWGWHRRIDVAVSGTDRCWRVGVEPIHGDDRELTAGDLPPELSLALFYWAQLRLPTRQEDVQLVGKLLSSALFPDAIAARFDRERQADDLLVRLKVDPESGLFNVPWEFVTAPWDSEGGPLAAGRTTNLVRVGPHRSPEKVSTVPTAGEAQLLGVVVWPADYELRMPQPPGAQNPKRPDVAGSLRTAAEATGLRVCILDPPTGFELDEAAQQVDPLAPVEVVHYIGFGRVDLDGPQLALLDDDGGLAWRPAAQVFKRVAESGARLFVAQFLTPPIGDEWEPIQPRTFLDALDGRVNAVVFNRVPIYAGREAWFNKELYKTLGAGETVETAVREARRRLASNPPPEDPASFAWYSLVTGDASDMRLLTPVSGQLATLRADVLPPPPQTPRPPREPATFSSGGGDALTR